MSSPGIRGNFVLVTNSVNDVKSGRGFGGYFACLDTLSSILGDLITLNKSKTILTTSVQTGTSIHPASNVWQPPSVTFCRKYFRGDGRSNLQTIEWKTGVETWGRSEVDPSADLEIQLRRFPLP